MCLLGLGSENSNGTGGWAHVGAGTETIILSLRE